MKERHIFCRPERLAYTTILQAATRYGAHVFPHLRIKEVANRDWINAEHFDYALKGHLDFTIAVDFRPVLAIELDGKFHQNAKAREGDARKDNICDALDIPLVRIDYGFMRPDLLQAILEELIDSWLNSSRQADVHSEHALVVKPTPAQVDTAKRKLGYILAAEIKTTSEFKIETHRLPNRYFESTISVVLDGTEHVLGKGRVRTPAKSRVCGALLAEQLASAEASTCIHTNTCEPSANQDDGLCFHSSCADTENRDISVDSPVIAQSQALPAVLGSY